MLRKLLKYEFKATARILLPLYIALLGFSVINKFFIGFGNDFSNLNGIGHIPAILSILGYVATMVAIVVVTLFIIIQRFYKNLLGDEGYLMNTLPVSINKNLTSKLIVGVAWNIISGLVAILSIVIMAYRPGIIDQLFVQYGGISGFFSEAYKSAGINLIIVTVECIIFVLVSMARGILMIYSSISLGHLASRRKILSSFGAFIVLSMVMNAITAILPSFAPSFSITSLDGINISINSFAPIHGFILAGLAMELIFAAIFYVICNYILKNKLNLE